MFRQMRRNRQQLSRERCEEILNRAASGVLAVLGDEGYPYAVPLSYVYSEGKFYFHCARQGHKLDAHPPGSQRHPSVSSMRTGWWRGNTPPIFAASSPSGRCGS